MNVIAATCLCVLAIISADSASSQLPSCVKPCKRNDPNLSKCWRTNLEKVRECPEEFQKLGVTSIDPWRTHSNVTFNREAFDIELTNVEYTGSKNFKVTENSVDLTQNRITLKVFFPKLNHFFTIISNGTMFNYTLNRVGCVQGFGDVTLALTLNGARKQRNGKEYIDFNDVTVNATGKSYREEVHDFVEGGPKANKLFDNVIKDNGPHFIPLYLKLVEKTAGDCIVKAIKNAYGTIELDVLHPK